MQITRRLEFDAGHRVLGHEGKCSALHGHRYAVEVTVTTSELDKLSRVVDFSMIKEKVGGWIDKHLDHNMLLHKDDPMSQRYDLIGRNPFIMQEGNPTAENIAKLLFKKSEELLGDTLVVMHVRVYETPNCFADYSALST